MRKVKKFIVSSIALIIMISLVSISVKADSSSAGGKHYISNASDDSSVNFTGFLKSCSDRELEQQAIDYENLNEEYINDVLKTLSNPNYNSDSKLSSSQLAQRYNNALSSVKKNKGAFESKIDGLNSTNFTSNTGVLHDLLVAINDEQNAIQIPSGEPISTEQNYNFDGVITGDATKYPITSTNNLNGYPTDFRTSDYESAIEDYEDDNGIVDDANNRLPTESQSALYKHILALEKEVNDLTADDNNNKKQISNLKNEVATLKHSDSKNDDKNVTPSNVGKHSNIISKKHPKKLTKRVAKKVQADKKAIAKLNKKLKSKHLTKKRRRSLIAKRAQLRKAVLKLTK